jgi:hypothetical protein
VTIYNTVLWDVTPYSSQKLLSILLPPSSWQRNKLHVGEIVNDKHKSLQALISKLNKSVCRWDLVILEGVEAREENKIQKSCSFGFQARVITKTNKPRSLCP